MGHKCNLLAPLPIGIGSPIAEAPSHTTGHAGPHPAIRLTKAELSNVPPSEFRSFDYDAYVTLLFSKRPTNST